MNLSVDPSSHRNVMMRLNLQLTMGTFSLSLFGLIGVAFGMNLQSNLEEVSRILLAGLVLHWSSHCVSFLKSRSCFDHTHLELEVHDEQLSESDQEHGDCTGLKSGEVLWLTLKLSNVTLSTLFHLPCPLAQQHSLTNPLQKHWNKRWKNIYFLVWSILIIISTTKWNYLSSQHSFLFTLLWNVLWPLQGLPP